MRKGTVDFPAGDFFRALFGFERETMKFRIGLYCGAKIYRISDWRMYPLFRKLSGSFGFSIGPILFWDGN